MKATTQRGFTLIEASIILLVLAILAGTLIPSLGGFNSMARGVKLREDLGVLCSTMKMMLDDLGDSAFFDITSGTSGSYASGYGTSYSGSYGATTSSGGGTVLQQTTETFSADGSGALAAGYGRYAGHGDDTWCEACNMPRAQCGPDCMDDCNEFCRHRPHEPVVSVTTQTSRQVAGSSRTSYATVGRTAMVSGGVARGGYGGMYGSGYPVGLLVGDGAIPASAIGATAWQLGLGDVFSAASNGMYQVPMSFTVDSLSDQLIHRDPTAYRYGAARSAYGGGYGLGNAGSFGTPFGATTGSRFRWRGPYIADRVTADPWGNRYMANVFALHVPYPGAYPWSYGSHSRVELFTSAVVCYSAGPNELIDTPFNQPWGWTTGGDDVTAVLAGAGGIR